MGHISPIFLKKLDVPIFSPFTSYYKTIEEWKNDRAGLKDGIGWSIAMSEFEGVIEPFIIGGATNKEGDMQERMPIEERCCKVARQVANWVKLRQKPVHERKVAFILHNNPCASVESTVGGGAHLDTLESVSRVMHRMKEVGYNVEPPTNGKELITTIMDRKAVSEFRWTTTDEIVKKGGVLKQITKEEYEEWFNTLSSAVKERMNNVWGKPPGEEINGMPPAMVHQDKILVTGVRYGNAVVCVQPKRGCAGARCDGQVCKILHDPDIPPPHQYMATYRYLERDFGVDVIVHVGTHGNLEFLSGKGTALSEDCYPDIGIGDIPHLYIYNADNPPEGTIAKRRSYATLVDHMQTVMTQGGLYEKLEELGRFLGEYEQVKNIDPSRTHILQHLIINAINLKTVDITYNKVVSDEYDLFGCCCYFGTQGGMTAAARHISGQEVKTYYGDTREPEHIEVRDLADEICRVVRTKLLNPKWIEGQKQHGYKGASDISKRIGRIYGWEATTQEVVDWIFDDIANTFVINEENKEFFKENNPWSLEEISRRLLEAHERGLWNANPDILKGLKNTYIEIEGWIEEKMGDVAGDFQGGSIDIYSPLPHKL